MKAYWLFCFVFFLVLMVICLAKGEDVSNTHCMVVTLCLINFWGCDKKEKK